MWQQSLRLASVTLLKIAVRARKKLLVLILLKLWWLVDELVKRIICVSKVRDLKRMGVL